MHTSPSKKKIAIIVGARPQLIKAAIFSRALQEYGEFSEILIHTGQHFDPEMSDVFFSQLNLRTPDVNLGIHGGLPGEQTGRMLIALEPLLAKERPDFVLVFGDTTSTLAGALAASKLHIPIAHVEAGLRSFNRKMPEEINRVLTDHLADLLFCPTQDAVQHLIREGISTSKIHNVGDVMLDSLLFFKEKAHHTLSTPSQFALATVHRAENTDSPDILNRIFEALILFSNETMPVLWPAHPRTRQKLESIGAWQRVSQNLFVLPPQGYLEMIALETQAQLILTDSGGVQREAAFLGTPCVVLRDRTEWVDLIEAGICTLADPHQHTEPQRLAQIFSDFYRSSGASNFFKLAVQKIHTLYGSGNASRQVLELLRDFGCSNAG